MDLLRAQWDEREQVLAQHGEIAIGMSQRGNALVDLDHVRALPRHLFARERAEHLPRSPTPADGQDEAGAGANGCSSVSGNDRGCRLGDGIGIAKNVYSHPTGFSTCPPNSNRIADSSLSPNVASPRERKRE